MHHNDSCLTYDRCILLAHSYYEIEINVYVLTVSSCFTDKNLLAKFPTLGFPEIHFLLHNSYTSA